MLDKTIYTKINESKCIGCGLCAKVCPLRSISITVDNNNNNSKSTTAKAKFTGTESISCGHCMAICPQGAITVDSIDKKTLEFNTFKIENKCIQPGAQSREAGSSSLDFLETKTLVELMLSRRSCRSYKDKEVSKEIIEDL
ncbi:MAG: 4Fe-4S binding protein, partial [Oligoflexia bacterium]|nr:4Fe-4S binding protein [Oligoflexia bacterium]